MPWILTFTLLIILGSVPALGLAMVRPREPCLDHPSPTTHTPRNPPSPLHTQHFIQQFLAASHRLVSKHTYTFLRRYHTARPSAVPGFAQSAATVFPSVPPCSRISDRRLPMPFSRQHTYTSTHTQFSFTHVASRAMVLADLTSPVYIET